jgi:hypothetical protein
MSLRLTSDDIENIDYGTVRKAIAGAPGYGRCQQAFQLSEIGNLSTNLFQVARGDVSDLDA